MQIGKKEIKAEIEKRRIEKIETVKKNKSQDKKVGIR